MSVIKMATVNSMDKILPLGNPRLFENANSMFNNERFHLDEPGLYPDVLRDIDDGVIVFHAYTWHTVWVTIDCSSKDIVPARL